jgi:tryptophan halogenase
LQQRVGNGIVFCSDFMDESEARETLLGSVEGRPLIEPRLVRYVTGRRREVWVGNCIAMGLSSGFVEPLESTSIHLFMIAVTRLIQQFPFGGSTPAQRERYNRMAANEIERVRDFIVLHYKLTERDDSPFWEQCRAMAVPDTLAERIALFAESAHCWQSPDDLFRIDSWVQVMLGQRLEPAHWHGVARLLPSGRLQAALTDAGASAATMVNQLPLHQKFVASYCPAE